MRPSRALLTTAVTAGTLALSAMVTPGVASASDHHWNRGTTTVVLGSLYAGVDSLEHGDAGTEVQFRAMHDKGIFFVPTLWPRDLLPSPGRWRPGLTSARSSTRISPANGPSSNAPRRPV